MTFTGSIPSNLPEYFRDIYGDATISWVPAVDEYNYPENLGVRTISDKTFRWKEVSISLDDVQAGALIDFTVPDSYIIQVTPDIGWDNPLAMMGEDEDLKLNNPHLRSFGPFSITAGNLTDNGDGTVTAVLSEADMKSATIPDIKKYLWRAVPWADGNPGFGGIPVQFDFVSGKEQLEFTVDDILKETRRAIQTISGTKSNRATITIQDENNPSVFVEQTDTSWRVQFTIDRPLVQFKIKAADASGTVIGFHQVSLRYETFNQEDGHVWNSFDSFALSASIDRLPLETNASLRNRIIDSFFNRGGSDYRRLIKSTNRELGLSRVDNAIRIERAQDISGKATEQRVTIDVDHTKITVYADSFIATDEVKKIDSYYNTVELEHRISSIISIATSRGIEIPKFKYEICDDPNQRTIRFLEDVKGVVRITYNYGEDIEYASYVHVGSVINKINTIANPSGNVVAKATLDSKMSGMEDSRYLFRGHNIITPDIPEAIVGWSKIGLFSISDEEWKESFRDSKSMFFGTNYYRYVKELKSQLSIEWGHAVADQNIWDPLDSDLYGQQSLEVPYDICLSSWSTPIKLPNEHGRLAFDPWESFRMGYYFDKHLIKNLSVPKIVFRSGVGFKTDCLVTVDIQNIRGKTSNVNQNPTVYKMKHTFDPESESVKNIRIEF